MTKLFMPRSNHEMHNAVLPRRRHHGPVIVLDSVTGNDCAGAIAAMLAMHEYRSGKRCITRALGGLAHRQAFLSRAWENWCRESRERVPGFPQPSKPASAFVDR